ncbi:hypothetical protein BsWGS_24895 [Bradybaena similaris]
MDKGAIVSIKYSSLQCSAHAHHHINKAFSAPYGTCLPHQPPQNGQHTSNTSEPPALYSTLKSTQNKYTKA